jgi:hypothetical protein
MPYAEKFRQKHMRDFERDMRKEHDAAVARVQKMISDGSYSLIGTQLCPMCPPKGRDTCNGSCETPAGCECAAIQLCEMPGVPAQPYVAAHDRRRKPSLWMRIKEWLCAPGTFN